MSETTNEQQVVDKDYAMQTLADVLADCAFIVKCAGTMQATAGGDPFAVKGPFTCDNIVTGAPNTRVGLPHYIVISGAACLYDDLVLLVVGNGDYDDMSRVWAMAKVQGGMESELLDSFNEWYGSTEKRRQEIEAAD